MLVDIEQVYVDRDDTVKFTFWVDDKKTLEYINTSASSWTNLADKSKAWDIAINTAVGGGWVGHPDEKLGWMAGGGDGLCGLERPQRATIDYESCSKERTAGKWYNDTIAKAGSPDGVDDIWLAPWNYGQPSADYIVDYVRVYSKAP